MRSLEGIKLTEISEAELEKKSISITDDYNFDDCVLTEKERLQKLKQELLNLNATQNNIQVGDDIEDYEDCRKNIR